MLYASMLLLSAACAAAAAAPVAPVANATDRLEALVKTMAQNQDDAGKAPAPVPVMQTEEVVMLDAEGSHDANEERRRLAAGCMCRGGYRNGASPGEPVCAKQEEGVGSVCYPPMANGGCSDHSMTKCNAATPAPSPLALPDAEEAVSDLFLNVNMQLSAPIGHNPSQLPSPEAFARTLAQITSVSANRVGVLTKWGNSPGVRAAGAVTTPGAQTNSVVTLHATIPVESEARRAALHNLLQERTTLSVDGTNFGVAGVQAFEQSARPIACGAGEHEPSNLLAQLVELNRQENDLLRQAVTTAQQSGAGGDLLQRVAARLGMTLH